MTTVQERKGPAAKAWGRSAAALTIAGTCLSATHALAAGFSVYEFNAEAIGSSYATATATPSSDYIHYNPAAIGGADDFEAHATFSAALVNSEFRADGGLTAVGTPLGGQTLVDDNVSSAFAPALSFAAPIGGGFTLGLGVHAPWGLNTEYPRDWQGRYYGTNTEFLTLNINPVIAYAPIDGLVIAAGPQIQYADGRLASAIDFGSIGAALSVPGAVPGGQDGFGDFEADDWAFGYSAGLMAEITDAVTIGVSYRSEIDHNLAGDFDFDLDGAGVGAFLSGATGAFVDGRAQTDISTPWRAGAGVRVEATNRLTLAANAWRTGWSSFEELRVVFDNPLQADEVTPADWRNVWTYSVGAEYAITPKATARLGAMHDRSPTRDATRTPQIPDADRIQVSGGATYRFTKQFGATFTAAHLFVEDAPIDLSRLTPANAFRGDFAGRSEASANILSLQLSYRL
ncbi:MAG: OmpP1/FadL family transporter [Pseudomonadota bacterium]